jgi:hypothetical protein
MQRLGFGNVGRNKMKKESLEKKEDSHESWERKGFLKITFGT